MSGIKGLNELDFEQWYVENAHNYPANPIGSRECFLQRKAWHAAIAHLRGEAAPEGQAVACQACGLPPISAGLPPLKTCQCARLVMRPQPAAPAPVAGDAVAALVERTEITNAPALPESWDASRAYVEAWMGYRRLVAAALAQDRASQGAR